MHVAINYSPEAAALLDAGRIDIDRYKCSDWERLVQPAQEQRPVYVHFPIVFGTPEHENPTLDAIDDWRSRTDTAFVNAHIRVRNDFVPADAPLEHIADALIAQMQPFLEKYGAETLIIENIPYCKRSADKGVIAQSTDPRLFQLLIERTGCGFLYDMSHAIRNCEMLDDDFETYTSALPLHALREFHVSGMGTWTTGERGDHMPMSAQDWERLSWCLQQIANGAWTVPHTVAFEYGGIEFLKELCGSDADAIAQDMPRLYWMVKKAAQARSASAAQTPQMTKPAAE